MHGTYEHLLLLRAHDEPVYPDVWQVVTGTVADGERADETARRELLEETGLVADVLHVLPYVATFFSATPDLVHLVPVFAACVPSNAVVTLSHEHQAFEWLPDAEALQRLVFPSHRDGLRIMNETLLHGTHPGIAIPA